jgi:hypothetical protein
LEPGFTAAAVHAKASYDNGVGRAADGRGQALDGKMVSADSAIPALRRLRLW